MITSLSLPQRMTPRPPAPKPRRATGSRSIFRGALRDRFTLDFLTSPMSADAEMWSDLRTLRDRSRTMVRDNPHGASLARVWVNGIVGPNGMTHFPLVENREGKLNLRVNDQLTDWWSGWGQMGNCTVDRRHSDLSLQRAIIRTECVDGEFLALEIEDSSVNASGYALQILDPDQLDETYTMGATSTHGEIRMGVELDEWGAPEFYHIWDRNPFDIVRGTRPVRLRIPATQVIHYFEPMRAGQTRGIPRLSPALYMMIMARRLDEGELIASIMAAETSFVYEQDPNHPVEDDEGEIEGVVPMDQRPGERTLLPPGVKAQMLQPNHPNGVYPEAARKWQRDMGASVGVAYHAFTGDMTQVNYTSSRTAELLQRDIFRAEHPRLAAVMGRIYRGALRNAVLRGELRFQKDDWREYIAHRFEGRGYDWTDPLKDITAAEKAIALRLDSRSRIAAESGMRMEDILREQARDQALAKELGVSMPDPLPIGIQAATTPDASGDPASQGNGNADTAEN